MIRSKILSLPVHTYLKIASKGFEKWHGIILWQNKWKSLKRTLLALFSNSFLKIICLRKPVDFFLGSRHHLLPKWRQIRYFNSLTSDLFGRYFAGDHQCLRSYITVIEGIEEVSDILKVFQVLHVLFWSFQEHKQN